MKDKTPLQPNRAGLIAHLLREWDACAYVRRRRGKGWGNGQEEVLLDADALLPDERHAALILETVGIAKGTRLQLMGRTALLCTFEDLVAAGIGTSQLATPRLEGEDIVAEVITTYAGREIGRERRSLKVTLLREALASLILAGSLFPNVGETLTRAVFDVAYDPAQKLVTLRWQRGIRQPALSAVLLPRWNNWKVQLDLRGQVRTVRP